MEYGLKETVITLIQTTLAKYPEVEQAILFGLRAKGNYKPYSDIDLVLLGIQLDLSILNKIELELDDLYLPYKLDLSIYHQISDPDVLEHIKRVGKLFYNKKMESTEEWKKYKLRDICNKIGSGATPTGGKESYCDNEEYALIRSQNVLDFTFSYNGLAYISESQAKKLNNVAIEEGDVLLNITGDSVARVCQVPNETLPARVNQHVSIIRPDNNILMNSFLKYYLLNPIIKSHLLNISAVGATRNAITKSMIENLDVVIPSIDKQKRITLILSSLDDKIELNRQTNKTLETIAQTLFKEMCLPKGEELPEGWRVESFENVFEVERGLSYNGAGLTQEGGIPMHNLNSVFEKGGYKTNGIKFYKGDYKEKHIVNAGELIVANTEQGHKYMLIGYPAIVPSFYGEKGIFSHHIYRLRPKDNCYLTSDFIYYLLLQPHIREQIIGFANGTTVNMLKIDGLKKPIFALPPLELSQKFIEIAKNSRILIEKNIQENQTLISLRDSLLPKLMKGEIEV